MRQHTDGVDVSAMIDARLESRLLGRHVAGSADDRVTSISRLTHGACDAEISDHRMPRPAFAGLTAWRFDDMLDLREPFLRIGDDVLIAGLPLELEPYGTRIFVVTRSA